MTTIPPLHQSNGDNGRPTDRGPALATQIRAYKQARRRRLQAVTAERIRRRVPRETEEIVGFAQMWIPYGGAPNAEIFRHFGMSASQFSVRLWKAVSDMKCAAQSVRRLAEVYPRPRTGFSSRKLARARGSAGNADAWNAAHQSANNPQSYRWPEP